MKEALPEKLDADYLRNFLAGRNGISPKNIRAKLEQNRLRKNSLGQLNAPSQQRRRTRSFNANPTNYQLGI
ncbi:MAG: hypothetical protein IKP42_03770 [Ruminococcus sp.]|nr:hypothetical protein [Ruminococcus sp.]